MSSYFKRVPYKQDMPPPGGYAKINIAQNLPKRGITGVTLMACGVGVMAFGWYFVIQGNRNRRELAKEKMIGRLSILPLLQAESDRTVLHTLKSNYEKEKEIMKDVPGWEVGKSVYNSTDRWVKPKQQDLYQL